MTTAMILAAGAGTRLRPLTHELPKPLVPIGDRPLLEHLAHRLVDEGFDELVLNAHHQGHAIEALSMPLVRSWTVSREEELLGTAGGLARARPFFAPGPVLVVNGDVFTEAPLRPVLHRLTETGAAACWLVRPRPLGEGTIGLDADGQVIRLRDVCVGEEHSGGDFLAIQALSSRLLEELPSSGCLVGDLLAPRLKREPRSIATVCWEGPWLDIGSLATYLEANLRWLSSRGLESFLAPSAQVHPEVSTRRSIVGEGARVEGHGTLSEVIVWPGATAQAPLERAVVTAKGVVPIAS